LLTITGSGVIQRLVGRPDLQRLHTEQSREAPARRDRGRVTLQHRVGRLQALGGIAIAGEGLQRMEGSQACGTAVEDRECRAIAQPGAVQDNGGADRHALEPRSDIGDGVVGHRDEDDVSRSRARASTARASN
jgi:hypothetical protein